VELVKSISLQPVKTIQARFSDYTQLIKMRLSFLVVFSASMAYLWATDRHVEPLIIWLLSIGGFLITGAANTFNQIIEKDSDKLMKRTLSRPLPGGRMKVSEALIFGFVLAIAGAFCLFKINMLCGLLGLAAMLIYAGIYTPLKKITPLTIFPGAVAGSLPVVIGCVAATGEITKGAIILFAIQFIWQFPHTWSIAWLLDDEYHKAGIKMLPTAGGRNKASAIIILLSTFLIIPAGLLLYMYQSAGVNVTWLLVLAGITFSVFAYKLYSERTNKYALRLMFSSFAYLPFVLIVLVLAKFL
jgi:protoheme IX farnesyltransferase